MPGAGYEVSLWNNLASFDDSGATGHKDAWVLEAGDYAVYVGSDVRAAQKQGAVTVPELRVLSQLEEVCAPVVPFERMVNKDGQVAYRSLCPRPPAP